ncbi:hypothetical protein PAXRUDRAFT_374836 [Paxillus rubicundulus Ve08.2h10]|uniref:Uncharacterized protein n=1 Tax=Paxillus rubicundulus Ve08.2h10 TaxID=930991 RepID=A0A0D0DDV8_9AGAM|nr:hypothetical protein PAXRUDRAFT_374836 [Paxillus rubicundulus Ve08.2h10]
MVKEQDREKSLLATGFYVVQILWGCTRWFSNCYRFSSVTLFFRLPHDFSTLSTFSYAWPELAGRVHEHVQDFDPIPANTKIKGSTSKRWGTTYCLSFPFSDQNLGK